MNNKDLNKVIELFTENKDVLSDEEVKKELEIGEKIVNLIKDDLKELSKNYIGEIRKKN